MQRASRSFYGVVIGLVALSLAAGACSDNKKSKAKSTAGGKGGTIAILLPETKTARYEAADRPLMEAKIRELCADCKILYSNADQDAAKQQQQAEAALTNGAKVMILDPVDSAAAANIVSKAKAKQVPVVSYDRLVKNADVDYYVSFDNVKVGKLQGQALADKLKADGKGSGTIVMINGSPTDNNATLFAQGYNAVLKPHFDDGSYTKVGEQAVPAWNNDTAQTIFTQAFTAHTNINTVVAANDGLGNSVINVLKNNKINAKTVPVTGQDATLQGMQNVLANYQCGSVYKPIFLEAQAAAALAIYLRASQTPPAALLNGTTKDTGATPNVDVPSVLLTPVWVTAKNMASTVIADKFVDKAQLCAGAFAASCSSAGIS